MFASNAFIASDLFRLAFASMAILLSAGLCAATLVYGGQIAAVKKESASQPRKNRKKPTIFR